MNSKNLVKTSIVTGVAICSAIGAIAAVSNKKVKARRMVRKAGQKIELVSTMLKSVADMAR